MGENTDINSIEALEKQKLFREIENIRTDTAIKSKALGRKLIFNISIITGALSLLIICISQGIEMSRESYQFERQMDLQEKQSKIDSALEKKKLEYLVIQKASELDNLFAVATNLDNYIQLGFIDKEEGYYKRLLDEGRINEIPYIYREFEFNTDSIDLATVTVTNSTTNPCEAGPADGCWSSTTYAEKGDTISVQIYFHNMSNIVAPGVGVWLDKSFSSVGKFHHFTGAISVGKEIVAKGVGKVITMVPASLRSVSRMLYFRNQSKHPNIINGVGGYIFSSTGLDIGDISPGWEGQGCIVINYIVGD